MKGFMLLVTAAEAVQIQKLSDQCHIPKMDWSPDEDDHWGWDEKKWVSGLAEILGVEEVDRMIASGGPYRVRVADWITR